MKPVTNYNQMPNNNFNKEHLILEKQDLTGFLSDIQNKISSISDEREDYSKYKKQSENGFNAFRQLRKTLSTIIDVFHITGLIDKADLKDQVANVNDFFKSNQGKLKKLLLNISRRDLQSKIDYLENQINTKPDSQIDEKQNLEQTTKTPEDISQIKDKLTAAFAFNTLGNKFLNLLNKVGSFESLDELDADKKEIFKNDFAKIFTKTKELILATNPELKDKLEKIDQETQDNPDPQEAYMNYPVAMIPVDISGKSIDVIDYHREGYHDLAIAEQNNLNQDMLDFYRYLSNLFTN